jgi:peptide-methionine (S)-S-oxide reductase
MKLFDIWRKHAIPSADSALPGRADAMVVTDVHAVLGRPICPPYPDHLSVAMFGMGCFWGVERKFWQLEGVWTTAVGYAGGHTPNSTYQEVCTGQTGHNEVVQVVFDPELISYSQLLTVFWEQHDPTQGMRQGNDIGTQYRSGIYVFDAAQQALAEESRNSFQRQLQSAGFGDITTEILKAPTFYFAEDYHQQYLHKNPGGYCGIGGTGVQCAAPTGVSV